MKAASALRAAAGALRGGARSIGGAPKLSCHQVAITVVDPQGRRFPVFGRVGTSLAEALAGSPLPELHGATVHLSPRHGPEAHVRVAHEFAQRMAALDDETRAELHDVAEEVAEDSRLASKIALTPELNGLVVAVAPMQPTASL